MGQFPGVNVNLLDNSNLPVPIEKKNYFLVQGITQLGKIGKPVFINSWEEYILNFGGNVANSNFPIYMNRLFESGVKGYVCPVMHYSDIADKNSVVGVKAVASQTISGNTATFIAEEVGDGYNGIVIKTKLAESGEANKIDITITAFLLDRPISRTVYNVPISPTITEIEALNEKLYWVELSTFVGSIPLTTFTLANGARDISTIIDSDYIGDAIAGTGFYCFDEIFDAVRIVNIDRASPAVDIAIKNYCELRGDIRFLIRNPIGQDLEAMVNYRNGTGPYSHSGIDSYLGSIWCGDILIQHPFIADKKITISAIADVLAAYSKKDIEGEWLSPARQETGRLRKILSIPYNVAKRSFALEAKRSYDKGLNFVINESALGFTLWGNNSLLKNKSSILTKDSVAELAVYLKRELPKYIKPKLFQPNDPKTWKEIYLSVVPFLESLVQKRAFIGGEKIGWLWLGDQNVGEIDNLSSDSINNKSDVSAGKYKVKFYFAPITPMEFVELELTISDAATGIQIVNP